MPGIGIGISPHFQQKKSLLSYWATRFLTIEFTDTQFTFKFKLPSTKTITLVWGDGDTEDVVGQDETIIEKESNYTDVGTYRFGITGDYEWITYIDISNQSFVSGDVSILNQLTPIKQPLVAFVLDDGYVQDRTVLYPIFSSKGHVANSAIITSLIGDTGKLSQSQILELQAAGWEIISHTVTHPDLRTLSAGDLHDELADSKSALEAFGCVVNSLCYPQGYYNDAVVAETLTQYRAGLRSVSYFPTTKGFVLYPIDWGRLERYASADYSGSQWIEQIGLASDTWKNAALIFYSHGLYMDEANQTALSNLLDYMNTVGLKMKTINQILDVFETYKECELHFNGTAVSFHSRKEWTSLSQTIDMSDCNLTSDEVDNALISLAHGCHLCTIKIGGNNARRTSASDSAVISLVQNQNTVECKDVLNFKMTSDGTIRNVSIKFKIDTGKNVYINWGDGLPSVQITANGTDQTVTSNYPTANRSYYIALYGEVEFIRTFELTNLFFTVDVAQFYQCPTLNRLSLTNIGSATGSVTALTSLTLLKVTGAGAGVSGSVAGLINLTSLHAEGANTLTGSINLLTSCTFMFVTGANTLSGNVENLPTSATYIWVSSPGCLVKYGGGATKAWQNTYMTIHGQWTTVMLDAFLNAWAATAEGTANRTIDLAGTNDPRSSASDAAVVSLEAKFKVFTFTA